MKCDICGRDNLTEKELYIHKKYFHKTRGVEHEQPLRVASGGCPECGATLWFQEGCVLCHSCGYERC